MTQSKLRWLGAIIAFTNAVMCFVAIWTSDLPAGVAGGAGAGWLFLVRDWLED